MDLFTAKVFGARVSLQALHSTIILAWHYHPLFLSSLHARLSGRKTQGLPRGSACSRGLALHNVPTAVPDTTYLISMTARPSNTAATLDIIRLHDPCHPSALAIRVLRSIMLMLLDRVPRRQPGQPALAPRGRDCSNRNASLLYVTGCAAILVPRIWASSLGCVPPHLLLFFPRYLFLACLCVVLHDAKQVHARDTYFFSCGWPSHAWFCRVCAGSMYSIPSR